MWFNLNSTASKRGRHEWGAGRGCCSFAEVELPDRAMGSDRGRGDHCLDNIKQITHPGLDRDRGDPNSKSH